MLQEFDDQAPRCDGQTQAIQHWRPHPKKVVIGY